MSNLKIALKFEADLKQFRSQFQNVTKDINTMVGELKTVGGLMRLHFVQELFQATKQVFQFVYSMGQAASTLLELRDQTGASLKSLQQYRFVAAAAGVEVDFFATSVGELITRLKDSDQLGSAFAKNMATIGVSVMDANKQMKPTVQIMEEILFALAEQENVLQRNSIGNEIFGGSWKSLAPVLALGKTRIKELTDEAERNGTVIGDDLIQAAKDAKIEMDKLNAVWAAAKIEIGANLAPTITNVLIPALEVFSKGVRQITKGNFTADAMIFGQIMDDFTRVKEAVENLNNESEETAVITKTNNQLIAEYKNLIKDLTEKINTGAVSGKTYNGFLMNLHKALAVLQNERSIKIVEQEIKDLQTVIDGANADSLPQLYKNLKVLNDELKNLKNTETPVTGAINLMVEQIALLSKTISSASKDELPAYNAQMQILEQRLQKLKELGKIALPEVPDVARGQSLFGEGMYDRFKKPTSNKIEGITEKSFLNIGLDRVEKIPGILEKSTKASFDFAQSFENSMLQIAASNTVAGDSMDSFAVRFAKSSIEVVRSLGAQAAAIAVRDALLKSGASPLVALGVAAVAVGAVNSMIGGILSGIGGNSSYGGGARGGSRGFTETNAGRRNPQERDRLRVDMKARLSGQMIDFSVSKYNTIKSYNS